MKRGDREGAKQGGGKTSAVHTVRYQGNACGVQGGECGTAREVGETGTKNICRGHQVLCRALCHIHVNKTPDWS